jgi:hypothetical protein
MTGVNLRGSFALRQAVERTETDSW